MANDETESLKDFSQKPPQGVIRDTQGFIHGLIAAAPLLSAAAASPAGAKQLGELLAKTEPLEIVIRDSFQTKNDFHQVYFSVANRSSQGIYLESGQLERPNRSEVHAKLERWNNTHPHVPLYDRPVFPYLLSPEQTLELDLRLNMCDDSELEREPYGLLTLTYSKLDEKKPATKLIQFRLRRHLSH